MKFTGERFVMGQAVGDIVIEHLQRYKVAADLVQGKAVLDAACGEGYGSFILSEKAASVVGIDISAQAVAYAAEKYQRENLLYQCASIETLPLADHSVDVVVSFETLEHVPAVLQRIFLAEIKRVLRPDGMLIMSSPDKHVYSEMRDFANPYHVHELYVDEFKDFLSGYFPYREFFLQGIDDKRLGVIERLGAAVGEQVRLLSDIRMDPVAMQYVIAVCSDQPLTDALPQKLVSVMPFVLDSPVRVFADCGAGFNESDVLVGTVRQEGTRFSVHFDFADMPAVQAMRFDPIEKCGCICRIEQLQGNIGGLTIQALNAFDVLPDGAERFLNDDPQYMVAGDFAGLEFLDITYVLQEIPTGELWRILWVERNRERAAKREREGEISRCQAAMDELAAARDSLAGELQGILNSRSYRLIKKYYGLRDFVLPAGSSRRLFVKNLLKAAFRYKRTLRFINRENMAKVMRDVRQGNFRQLIVKIDSKLSSAAVEHFINQAEIVYSNDLLMPASVAALPEEMVFDIVVPIYNAFAFVEKCLTAVYENTTVPYHLYLLDDCSTDARLPLFLKELENTAKPSCLRELHIIHNEENLGFIKSVNKGMALGKNHVVLLNTDTEVPPHWLERLAAPLLQDPLVASVTPFSNSATICSFPKFCENNDLPYGMTAAEIDQVFAAYGGTAVLELPTGVGFCMLLNRQTLELCGDFDTVYGKGYAEENDWCRRAAKQGFKHVLAGNVFVYHKHGMSFAEQTDKKKEERIQDNLNLLLERYPEYASLVDAFIARDPGKRQREFLQSTVFAKRFRNKEGILFINHALGGGTQVYQDKLVDAWREEKRLYGLEIQADCRTLLLRDYNEEPCREFYFDLTSLDEMLFKNCLAAFEIQLIYINQLVTYPLPRMIDLIRASAVEYTFFVHDFYAVCPLYTLLDAKGRYCQAEQRLEVCNACLGKAPAAVCSDIGDWRKLFQDFLLQAKDVIAPSQNTADLLKRYYPEVEVRVKEHEISPDIYKSFREAFAEDEVLTIAVVGAISEAKGSAILYDLADKIAEEKLPLRLKVIGITNLQNAPYQRADRVLEITGPYDNAKISELLADYRVGAVLIPSIWPETYSYTASEAMHSGYPVITFNIGAPAERVKRYDCGWVIDEMSSLAVLQLLKKLLVDRNLIKNKSYGAR